MPRSERSSPRTRFILAFLSAALAGAAAVPARAVPADTPHALSRASFALFELHRQSGRVAAAQGVLERLDRTLAPAAAERLELATAYERLGQEASAIAVWEDFAGHGGQLAVAERMKVAHLYEEVGKREQALRSWQTVWNGRLPAVQRSIVADRILTIAAEEGRLAELAAELEIKHRTGKADRHDTGLLVRVYVEGRQALSAVECIDELFAEDGADQVQILKERAKVYRLLGDSESFQRTTRRLVSLDPSGTPQYLRELVLAQLADERPDRLVRLSKLLAELRDRDAAHLGGDFEAGVLALAGFADEATTAYRRLTALQPLQPDGYLLLGDALKRQGLEKEATLQFQYLAENAPTRALLVAGVDGLLNLLPGNDAMRMTLNFNGVLSTPRGRESAQSGQRRRTLIGWAQRLLIEQLILEGDNFQSYGLLAELFQENQDGVRHIEVLDNSLPLAGGVRSTSLRELIALVTPVEETFATGAGQHSATSLKDAGERRLAYGRRLIALREALPPETYLNAGHDFLDRMDTASAARAFNLAVDVTGRADLRGEIAKLYDKTGFDELALGEYRLALIRDSGNVALMVRLARVMERTLQREEANAIYVATLQTLLLRQPQQVQLSAPDAFDITNAPQPGHDGAIGGPTTLDFKTYYEPVLQGVLATWPTQHERGVALLSTFEALFDTDLNAARASGATTPKNFLRLDRMGAVVTHLALASGEIEFADRIAARQRKVFTTDPGLSSGIARVRAQWGYRETVLRDGRLSLTAQIEEALAEAERSRSYEQVINLAVLSGDESQMLQVARSWAKAGFPGEAVAWAQGRLRERNFRNLCRYAANLLREKGRAWLVDVLIQPQLVASLEEAIGQPLFSSAGLLDLLTPIGDASNQSIIHIPVEAYASIVVRLTAEHRLTLLRMLVAKEDGLAASIGYWRELLKLPLDAAFAQQAADLVLAAIERSKDTANTPFTITALLIEPQIHPDNIEISAKLIARWTARLTQPIDYFRCLALLKQGRLELALDDYLDVLRRVLEMEQRDASISTDNVSAPLEPLRKAFLPRYRQALKHRLDVLEARQGRSASLAALNYRALYAGSGTPSSELEMFLTAALDESPDDEIFLAQLQSIYQAEGLTSRATPLIERLRRLDPDEMVYRAALFAAYVSADRPVDAWKLNEDSPEDMRATAFLKELALRRGKSGSSSPVGVVLIPEFSLHNRSAPSQFNTCTDLAGAIRSGDSKAAQQKLRALWLTVTALDSTTSFWRPESYESYDRILACGDPDGPVAGAASKGRFGNSLLEKLQGAAYPAGKTTIALVTEHSFSVGELEDYLRSTPAAQEQRIYPLYTYLVAAYAKHGLADEKRTQLGRAITEGRANFRDITLWLSLLTSASSEIPATARRTLDKLDASTRAISLRQLMLMARIYAAGGESARAMEVYRRIAVRSLIERQQHQLDFDGSSVVAVSAVTLLEEAGRHLDAAHHAQLSQDILRMLRPAPGAAHQLHEAHDLLALTVGGAAESGEPQFEWAVAKLIAVANQHMRAGELDSGLAILKLAMRTGPASMPISDTEDEATLQNVFRLSEYTSILGVTLPFDPHEALVNFAPGASAPALRRAAAVLEEWRVDPAVDSSKRLVMLGVVAYRLHAARDAETAAVVLHAISAALGTSVRYPRLVTDFMLDVARVIDGKLDLSAERSLLSAGQLQIEQIATVIERTAREEGVARALERGEEAAVTTQNDNLLALLVRLATESGDAARAERWQLSRSAAAHARQALGMQ